MFTQPTRLPEWATGGSAQVIEPSGAKKQTGWVPDERPAAEFFNDYMKLVYEWIGYLDEQVVATTAVFQAIVGDTGVIPEATHDTLNDVMADGGVANGATILCLDSQALDTTQTISKSRVKIVFGGAVEYTKGGGAPATNFTGINISAEGVRIEGGRFDGFEAAGDKVFDMQSSADYCVFRDCRFAASQTENIDDSQVNAGRKPRIEVTQEV